MWANITDAPVCQLDNIYQYMYMYIWNWQHRNQRRFIRNMLRLSFDWHFRSFLWFLLLVTKTWVLSCKWISSKDTGTNSVRGTGSFSTGTESDLHTLFGSENKQCLNFLGYFYKKWFIKTKYCILPLMKPNQNLSSF